MASFNAAHLAALDSAARQRQHNELKGMNAYDRHKRFVHDLTTYYGGTLPSLDKNNNNLDTNKEINPQRSHHQYHEEQHHDPSTKVKVVKTDEDVLLETYRFIRKPEDDADVDSWSVRLAKKYYSRLFREYCIADLSRYKEGKLGLRWRTQREVVDGRGQFTCGTRGCEERRGLASFEVPFGYVEAGEKKQALVKVRLCPDHAYQLNYRKNREAEKRQKAGKKEKEKKDRKKSKKRRKTTRSPSSSTSNSSGSTATDSGTASEVEEEDEVRLRHRKKSRQSADRQGLASDEVEEFFDGLFE